jgi:hypothetical protein
MNHADRDARLELLDELSKLVVEHSAELDVSEAAWLAVIEHAVEMWRTWWLEGPSTPEVSGELNRKFRVCFPLAAHALSHIQAATAVRSSSPWVAVSSARIAFEHALVAQWVLLTENGEDQLAQEMSLQDHRRSIEFVSAVRRSAIDEPALTESASLACELQALIGEKPSSDWSVAMLCDRFSPTRLFYNIYRDLTQAVHPSYGLIGAYLEFTAPPESVVRGVNTRGAALQPAELTRSLALAGLWALYVLEVCRAGHPHAADVIQIGEAVGLPVDLRASDQRPHLQPPTTRSDTEEEPAW